MDQCGCQVKRRGLGPADQYLAIGQAVEASNNSKGFELPCGKRKEAEGKEPEPAAAVVSLLSRLRWNLREVLQPRR